MSVLGMSVVDTVPKEISDESACTVCLRTVGDLRSDSAVKCVVEKTSAGSRIACLDCVKGWFTSATFSQHPSRKSPITQRQMRDKDFDVIGCSDVTAGVYTGNVVGLIGRLEKRLLDVRDDKNDALQELAEARRRAPFGGLLSSFKGLEQEIKDLDAQQQKLANRIQRLEKYKGVSTRNILKSSMYSIATAVCSVATLGSLMVWASHNPIDKEQDDTSAKLAVGFGLIASFVGSVAGSIAIHEPITEVLERWENS